MHVTLDSHALLSKRVLTGPQKPIPRWYIRVPQRLGLVITTLIFFSIIFIWALLILTAPCVRHNTESGYSPPSSSI